jgi:hypothetical protein
MSVVVASQAINSHNLVQFHYNLGIMPGVRVVEPHMIATNEAENLVLSGWFVGGASGSQEGPGWREYLFSGITNMTILPQVFAGARPGYNPTGGRKFHNVQAAV